MVKSSFSASERKGVSGVLSDLYHGFLMGHVWRHFAWDEIQNRYRRSALGIAWIGLSYLFFICVIVLFFRGLGSDKSESYSFHVAVGFAAFNFIIGNINDGCDVFRTATTWIKSSPIPYSIYIYKSIARSIFTFIIQFSLALVVIIVLGWRPTLGALMIFPAFLIFLVNAVSIQLIFGLFATRFNDVVHLTATVTRIAFFATPIIWQIEERAGLTRTAAIVNPLTHYVEIFRAPLLGTPMLDHSWLIVLGFTFIGWIVAIIASVFMLRRLPFWL